VTLHRVPSFHPITLLYLGEVDLRLGRLTEASVAADRVAELTRAYQQRGYHAWALRMLGEVAAHPARFQADVASARHGEAIRLASHLAMRPLVDPLRLSLGKLYRLTGRGREAHEHLTAAAAMYRDLAMPSWLKRAEEEARREP
jgi:hypothetical protein